MSDNQDVRDRGIGAQRPGLLAHPAPHRTATLISDVIILAQHSHTGHRTRAHAATAPRGALLYPRLSREGLEGRFLGLMADLDGKPEGDNSMPGK
jgi:hypothetical protein